MEKGKPILATNIDGLLIKHEAFIEPHKKWFDKVANLLGDESIKKWKGTENYFEGVNKAMERLMPSSTKEERTAQARKWYQESIVEHINENPDVIIDDVVSKLKELKNKFTLALVTTNTKEDINNILNAAGLERIYDIVFASSEVEEPNKKDLFRAFVEKYGKPRYFVSARNGERFESCLELGIVTVYVGWDYYDSNLEEKAEIKVRNPEGLDKL